MLRAAVVCADVPPGWQACVSKAFKQHSSMLCAAVVCADVPLGQLCSDTAIAEDEHFTPKKSLVKLAT